MERLARAGGVLTGPSLDAQRVKLKAYVELYELKLVDVIEDDGYGAKSSDSDGVQLPCIVEQPRYSHALTMERVRERGRAPPSIVKADPERVRTMLQEFFGDEILVKPLGGSWGKGWLLKLKTRPWTLALPKDAVVSGFGCGGRI